MIKEELGKKVLEAAVDRKNHVCAMPNKIFFVCENMGIILWKLLWNTKERLFSLLL